VAWNPTPYTVVGVVAALLFFLIAAVGRRHRSQPAAKAFLALITAMGGWALCYAVGLGFTTLDAQLVWQRSALAIGGLVPSLWFLFAVQYTNREAWLTPTVRAVMIVDPLVFGLLTLTNPTHGLVWSDPVLVAYGSLHAVEFAFGPAYLLHLAYTYVVTPVGFGLLLLSTVRSTLYRTQAGLLLVGAIPPLVANTTFTLGIEPGVVPSLDYTPFAFVVTGPCFGLALFRFDLLERVPVARRQIVADADDGFVVLDQDLRAVTANPSAERILGGPIEGDPIAEQFPADEFDFETVSGTTLTTVVEGQQRAYDVTHSTLSDDHGRTVGYVLQFRDVTDRHTYQQRLKVANRVLRHDLRNRMNVITGWADELAGHESEDVRVIGERITATADELIELGEQVRLLVETADYAGRPTESVDLGAHVDPLVDRIRDAHPTATVETELPAETRVLVPHPRLLTISVESLLENAVEHNDADRPWVTVTVEPASETGDYTRLHIADDGPGIPEAELEALREGSETPLKHGSGLGLWLVHWTVTAAGGTVTFEERDPRGSVVTLAFRPGD
jgi:signal transduction histidine kinase